MRSLKTLTALAFLTLPITAYSQCQTSWTSVDMTGNWDDPLNWAAITCVPGSNGPGDQATFNGGNTGGVFLVTLTNTSSSAYSPILSELIFNSATSYTISNPMGGYIGFDPTVSSNLIESDAGTHTISAPIVLTNATPLTINNTAAFGVTLTLSGGISESGGSTSNIVVNPSPSTGDVVNQNNSIVINGTFSVQSGEFDTTTTGATVTSGIETYTSAASFSAPNDNTTIYIDADDTTVITGTGIGSSIGSIATPIPIVSLTAPTFGTTSLVIANVAQINNISASFPITVYGASLIGNTITLSNIGGTIQSIANIEYNPTIMGSSPMNTSSIYGAALIATGELVLSASIPTIPNGDGSFSVRNDSQCIDTGTTSSTNASQVYGSYVYADSIAPTMSGFSPPPLSLTNEDTIENGASCDTAGTAINSSTTYGASFNVSSGSCAFQGITLNNYGANATVSNNSILGTMSTPLSGSNETIVAGVNFFFGDSLSLSSEVQISNSGAITNSSYAIGTTLTNSSQTYGSYSYIGTLSQYLTVSVNCTLNNTGNITNDSGSEAENSTASISAVAYGCSFNIASGTFPASGLSLSNNATVQNNAGNFSAATSVTNDSVVIGNLLTMDGQFISGGPIQFTNMGNVTLNTSDSSAGDIINNSVAYGNSAAMVTVSNINTTELLNSGTITNSSTLTANGTGSAATLSNYCYGNLFEALTFSSGMLTISNTGSLTNEAEPNVSTASTTLINSAAVYGSALTIEGTLTLSDAVTITNSGPVACFSSGSGLADITLSPVTYGCYAFALDISGTINITVENTDTISNYSTCFGQAPGFTQQNSSSAFGSVFQIVNSQTLSGQLTLSNSDAILSQTATTYGGTGTNTVSNISICAGALLAFENDLTWNGPVSITNSGTVDNQNTIGPSSAPTTIALIYGCNITTGGQLYLQGDTVTITNSSAGAINSMTSSAPAYGAGIIANSLLMDPISSQPTLQLVNNSPIGNGGVANANSYGAYVLVGPGNFDLGDAIVGGSVVTAVNTENIYDGIGCYLLAYGSCTIGSGGIIQFTNNNSGLLINTGGVGASMSVAGTMTLNDCDVDYLNIGSFTGAGTGCSLIAPDLIMNDPSASLLLENDASLLNLGTGVSFSGTDLTLTAGSFSLANESSLTNATGVLAEFPSGASISGTVGLWNIENNSSVTQTAYGVYVLVSSGTMTMSGGNVELINTQPISINSYGSLIEVQAGMSAGGNLTMTGGTINITANPSTTDGSSYGSAVLIDDGATLGQLNVNGGLYINDDNTFVSNYTIGSGGTAAGTGTFQGPLAAPMNSFSNGGVLVPGEPASTTLPLEYTIVTPGTLNINGAYSQTSNGILSITVVNSSMSGMYSQLEITGTATLGSGIVQVAAPNDAVINNGDQITILTATGGWSGMFNPTTMNINLPVGVTTALSYPSGTNVLLTFSRAFTQCQASWTSADMTGNWDDPANWSPMCVPGSTGPGDTATFNGGNTGGIYTVTLGTYSPTLATLTFNSTTPYIINTTSGTIAFDPDTIPTLESDAGSHTINAPIVLTDAGPLEINNTAMGTTLTLTGGISEASGSSSLNFNESGAPGTVINQNNSIIVSGSCDISGGLYENLLTGGFTITSGIGTLTSTLTFATPNDNTAVTIEADGSITLQGTGIGSTIGTLATPISLVELNPPTTGTLNITNLAAMNSLSTGNPITVYGAGLIGESVTLSNLGGTIQSAAEIEYNPMITGPGPTNESVIYGAVLLANSELYLSSSIPTIQNGNGSGYVNNDSQCTGSNASPSDQTQNASQVYGTYVYAINIGETGGGFVPPNLSLLNQDPVENGTTTDSPSPATAINSSVAYGAYFNTLNGTMAFNGMTMTNSGTSTNNSSVGTLNSPASGTNESSVAGTAFNFGGTLSTSGPVEFLNTNSIANASTSTGATANNSSQAYGVYSYLNNTSQYMTTAVSLELENVGAITNGSSTEGITTETVNLTSSAYGSYLEVFSGSAVFVATGVTLNNQNTVQNVAGNTAMATTVTDSSTAAGNSLNFNGQIQAGGPITFTNMGTVNLFANDTGFGLLSLSPTAYGNYGFVENFSTTNPTNLTNSSAIANSISPTTGIGSTVTALNNCYGNYLETSSFSTSSLTIGNTGNISNSTQITLTATTTLTNSGNTYGSVLNVLGPLTMSGGLDVSSDEFITNSANATGVANISLSPETYGSYCFVYSISGVSEITLESSENIESTCTCSGQAGGFTQTNSAQTFGAYFQILDSTTLTIEMDLTNSAQVLSQTSTIYVGTGTNTVSNTTVTAGNSVVVGQTTSDNLIWSGPITIDNSGIVDNQSDLSVTSSSVAPATESIAYGCGLTVAGQFYIQGNTVQVTNSSGGSINSMSSAAPAYGAGIIANSLLMDPISSTATLQLTNNAAIGSMGVTNPNSYGAYVEVGTGNFDLGDADMGGPIVTANNYANIYGGIGCYLLANGNVNLSSGSVITFANNNSGGIIAAGTTGTGISVLGTMTLNSTSVEFLNTSPYSGTGIGSSLIANTVILNTGSDLFFENTAGLTGPGVIGTYFSGTNFTLNAGAFNLSNQAAIATTGYGAYAVVSSGTVNMSGGTVTLSNSGAITDTSYGSLFEVQANGTGGNLTMTDGTIYITANTSSADTSSYGSAIMVDDGSTLGQLNVDGGLYINDDHTLVSNFTIGSGGTVAGAGTFQGTGAPGTSLNLFTTSDGSVLIPGDPAAQTLPIDYTAVTPGVMYIDGNYTQTSNGILSITVINSSMAGMYSQLEITGTATLGNGLVQVAAPNNAVINNGDQITILSAGAGQLMGTFNPITMNINLPVGITTTLSYDPDTNVILTFGAPSPPPSPPLPATVCPTLKSNNTGAFSQTIIAGITELNTILEREMQRLRDRFHPCPPPKTESIKKWGWRRNIDRIKDERPKHESKKEKLTPCLQEQRSWNLYAGPIGISGEGHTYRKQTGYDYWSAGGILGTDYGFERGGIGALANYQYYQGQIHQHEGKFSSQQAHGSLYGTYAPNAFSIDAIVGGGYNWYNFHRYISGQTAVGKPTGSEFDALLDFEYTLSHENVSEFSPGFRVIPMASAQYIYLNINKYKEHGADASDLNFNTQHIKSLTSILGTWIDYTWTRTNFLCTLEANLGWQYEYLNTRRTVHYAALNAPSCQNLSLTMPGPKKNSFIAGLDLFFLFSKRFGLEASYDFQGNSLFHSHSVYVGFNAEF